MINVAVFFPAFCACREVTIHRAGITSGFDVSILGGFAIFSVFGSRVSEEAFKKGWGLLLVVILEWQLQIIARWD